MKNTGPGPMGALTSISGGSLSYTPIGNHDTDVSWGYRIDIYTAAVGTPSNMTITVDDDTNVYSWGMGVTAYTGYDSGTPITGYIDTADNVNIGDGAEEQTLTAAPTTNDVSLSYILTDGDSYANPTYASGWNDVYEAGNVSYGSVSCVERTSSMSTTVSVTDSYTGAGTFYKGAMISFNVKAAGGGTTTVNAAASALGAAGQALTVVEGAVSKALSAGGAALTGQTLSVVEGLATVNASASALNAAGQPLTIVEGEASINMDDGALSLAGQAVTVDDGTAGIVIELDPA